MPPGTAPVMVGTDFSDGAAVALMEARRLAALLNTGVTVVHVEEPQGSASWRTSGAASRWLDRAAVPPQDLVVRQGSAWVELARCAAELNPPLLVVGSHGQSGYQPLSLGSTASRLTLQAACPVVVVSPRVRPLEAITTLRSAPASKGVTAVTAGRST